LYGADWAETGLIFTFENDPAPISHLFSRIALRAGLGHWHAHELRHSGASLMRAGWTPLHVVSEALGHASIFVTKDVYGHLVEGDRRSAADTITAIVLPPAPSDD
jgi:integrase